MVRFAVKFFIFLVVMGCSFYSLYRVYKNKLFKVSHIEYIYTETNPYLKFQHSKVEDRVDPNLGQLIWDVDIFELEKKLETLSWIQDVRVTKKYPDQLEIELEPKAVAANLLRTSTKVQPISVDAQVMEVADISKSPDAPLLADRRFLTDEALRKKALQLLSDLPEDGSMSKKNVSEISPFTNNNFQIFLKHSHAVVLMDTENVPLKAARVSRVIDYMDSEELKSRIIDANFSKKVLVKPRNHR